MRKGVREIELREKEHFDASAEKYDANYDYLGGFTRYKISKKSRELVSHVNRVFGKKRIRVLELGCGTGEYTKLLATRIPTAKIFGLDISDRVLGVARDKCRKLSNVSFVNRSAYRTGFSKGYFDVVCGFYVLHHLNVEKVIGETVRVMKEGGLAFFYEPNLLNPIVYLVKSIGFLKRAAGDSPDEWAINPLTVGNELSDLRDLNIKTTEFVAPFKSVPLKVMKTVDKAFSVLGYVPVLNLLGGSVRIVGLKR